MSRKVKVFIAIDIVAIVLGITLLVLGSYIGAIVLLFGVVNGIRDCLNARKASKVQTENENRDEQQ